MKKLFFLLLLISQIIFSQSNIVEISTTGSGETKEQAVQNALLSALKQSFGVFISSNTEIINDVLTKDKISELSSGNILEYNIISETENGDYYNTLVSSKISMNTLASYTKNKVDSNEISGDVFVSNFLIKELNKENELQSIKDLIEYSKKVLPTTLDFYVNSGEPISINDEQISKHKSYQINDKGESSDFDKNNFPYQFIVESKIGFKQNVKYKNWRDHFNRTIKSIVLNEDEISEYVNSNIDTYPFILNNEILNLRNYSSIDFLIQFSIFSNNFANYFTLIYNGINKSYEFKDFDIHLKRYGFKTNKVPNDLIVGDLDYAIIENGKIEFFRTCVESNSGKIGGYYSNSTRLCSRDRFQKYFVENKKHGKARFPYNYIIFLSQIERGIYPIRYQKNELIGNYFDSNPSSLRKNNDFPKKYRTKDNYKKIENELLILYQGEFAQFMKMDGFKNYINSIISNKNLDNNTDELTLILQTNLSFDQFRIINSYFTLEELKKFRGFQISNSN